MGAKQPKVRAVESSEPSTGTTERGLCSVALGLVLVGVSVVLRSRRDLT